jgi:hypothetical protein
VRDVVKVGRPVRLEITTTNISDHTIRVFRDIGGRDELNPLYKGTVWNTNGNRAPEANLKRHERGHSILFTLNNQQCAGSGTTFEIGGAIVPTNVTVAAVP